jgi:uncharacterized protein (TIGR02300 family)
LPPLVFLLGGRLAICEPAPARWRRRLRRGSGAPRQIDELEFHVAKAEWGTKRICPSCSARYYDLGKQLGDIVCPKCSTQFDPEAFLKTRRARVAAIPEKEVEPVAAEDVEIADADAEAADGEEGVAADGDEEEEEELIEDASELGEDEDDMAEVIENVEDEEER